MVRNEYKSNHNKNKDQHVYQKLRVGVVIPAYNEAHAIAHVVNSLFNLYLHDQAVIDSIVVCDNHSSDKTAAIAKAAGAIVTTEYQRGYGAACQSAIRALPDIDVIVFVDGDAADDISDVPKLLEEIAHDHDLVIGSRKKLAVQGALLLQQRIANWCITKIMTWLWGRSFTDLGPMRAVRYAAYKCLHMQDLNYGWTVEMQIKAVQLNLNIKEIDVHYHRRIGYSKISGSWRGFIAAIKICSTIFKFKFSPKNHSDKQLKE